MRRLPLDSAARIAGLYVVFAGLYVFFTDVAVGVVTEDPESRVKLEIYKGWILLIATATLLYIERRRADRGLRHLAAIVQSSDDAIIGLTLEGAITSWNEGAQRIYDYSFDEVRDQSASMLMPPDRLDDLPRLLARVKRGESVRRYETVRVRKSGERVYISVTYSPIKNDTGRVTGVSTIARDMTDRKRADSAARMAEVGKLSSGLVHEVRNPLNAMRMQAAVIKDKLSDPDAGNVEIATAQLSRLENEILRLHALVSEFLAFGRPVADRPEEFTVSSLVREVADFIRPDSVNRHVEIKIGVAPEAEDGTVVMDRNKLRQVVLNLTYNSKQAMPDGGVLSIGLTRSSANWTSITVRDTGCGVPEEKLEHIFDAFYSTRREGTGLGLAIVKQIIDAVDGTITVDSEVGRGTCFTIGLPGATPARRMVAKAQAGIARRETSQ